MMFLPKMWSRQDRQDLKRTPNNDGPMTEGKTGASVSNVHDGDGGGGNISSGSSSHVPTDGDDHAQKGVEEMEATIKVWSLWQIYLAYIFIWVIYFVDSMHSGMSFTLTPYVTSAFSRHGLTATTSVFAQLIGALIKLPLAKILDIWGRCQGLALTLFFMLIGLVMMAACKDVETYAAAQVFYWIGFNGIAYSLQVFTADTSDLKNRAFIIAFINTPFIVSTPTSGYASEAFLKMGSEGWRWAFGIFCIIVPVVMAPIFFLFLWNQRKARRVGVLAPRPPPSGRTLLQSLRYYAIEFDLLGIFLAAAGMTLFLLPFNIYSYQDKGWASPVVLTMLILSIFILACFVLYEKYLAPVKFIPFALLVDRTIMGACLTTALCFVSFYIWNAFFSSFLQVVTGASIVQATWVGRIYNIGSCIWALVVGALIRYTGRFKWLAFYIAVPLQIIGVALMILFRQPGRSLGLIVMAQIFIAIAGGTFVICEQIAVMAAVPHRHVAVVLALLAMFSSIGGAIGSTLSAAIWNGVFPAKLKEYLPSADQDKLESIVASLPTQLSFRNDSRIRDAINYAYADAQRIMLITATGVLALTIFTVAMWRDLKVKDFEQRSLVKR